MKSFCTASTGRRSTRTRASASKSANDSERRKRSMSTSSQIDTYTSHAYCAHVRIEIDPRIECRESRFSELCHVTTSHTAVWAFTSCEWFWAKAQAVLRCLPIISFLRRSSHTDCHSVDCTPSWPVPTSRSVESSWLLLRSFLVSENWVSRLLEVFQAAVGSFPLYCPLSHCVGNQTIAHTMAASRGPKARK